MLVITWCLRTMYIVCSVQAGASSDSITTVSGIAGRWLNGDIKVKVNSQYLTSLMLLSLNGNANPQCHAAVNRKPVIEAVLPAKGEECNLQEEYTIVMINYPHTSGCVLNTCIRFCPCLLGNPDFMATQLWSFAPTLPFHYTAIVLSAFAFWNRT